MDHTPAAAWAAPAHTIVSPDSEPSHAPGGLSDVATELPEAIDSLSKAIDHLRLRAEPVMRSSEPRPVIEDRIRSSTPTSPLAHHLHEQVDRIRSLEVLVRRHANDLDLN